MNATPPIAAFRDTAQSSAGPEECDFCRVPLTATHRHLLEMDERKLVCVCDSCAFRFAHVAHAHFKLIPRDPKYLGDLKMTDEQWYSLAIPICFAFFYRDSRRNKVVALYPSPTGALESVLTISTWSQLVSENPPLAEIEEDVECLLINRVNGSHDAFVVPLDACYELTGIVRSHWHGLTGGEKLWGEVRSFITELRERCATAVSSQVYAGT